MTLISSMALAKILNIRHIQVMQDIHKFCDAVEDDESDLIVIASPSIKDVACFYAERKVVNSIYPHLRHTSLDRQVDLTSKVRKMCGGVQERKQKLKSTVNLYVAEFKTEHETAVKIGVSRDLKRRLRTLSTSSGRRLIRYSSFATADSMGIETYLKRDFKKYNMQGEWFSLAYTDVISRIMTDKHLQSKYQPKRLESNNG